MRITERETYRGETFWRMLGWIVFIVVMLWVSARAQAQEQYVRACQSSYACQLGTGVSWSAPVQTWVFTPFQPNISLRIWIHNNNTTSAHTAQTLTLWVTDSTTANESLINHSDVWVQAAITDNVVVGAQCLNINANASTTVGASGKGTCYAKGMFAAQVAIQFTPGGAAAGSPDTFDIGIVQQPSTDPSGPRPGQSGDENYATKTWTLASFPGAGNQATVSRAAGGTNVKHVIDCLSFSVGASTAPAAAAGTDLIIRDGASGVGTIIFQGPNIVYTAATGTFGQGTVCGLEVAGSANTILTVEFRNVAGNLIEVIGAVGHDTQ